MMDWEYHRLNFVECRKMNTILVDEQRLMDRLNELGRQGWELASYCHNWQHETSGFAILKRRLPPPSSRESLEELSQELTRSD